MQYSSATFDRFANCVLSFLCLGIEVRHRHNATSLMHHKFVVIDKCVLMTGSLNWTMQAFCGNWDNIIVTTRPPVVKSFLQEFDRAWKIME